MVCYDIHHQSDLPTKLDVTKAAETVLSGMQTQSSYLILRQATKKFRLNHTKLIHGSMQLTLQKIKR